ncbi:LacI family DNA-binding transcriptional regulator [Paenibacillus taichungensis]|uniref:LacI family DNA-binding transcriptional regulator n=1 Tax=Paenibacillus taichungensis TaxID=484184 RepID=UPI002870CD2A|nr:LacI family DNA-binding transcriptional regulator [Paenibacillus taichungensis]MDR9749454.1 LacI family DNA-binding transcriptional regulator [Paenibacillus taichungensis]MEC0110319.1 LacI family DNA-binding transcriptional regulator [Paenibacillus taichungensis]MEC0199246.1 LacI family DNA-binding transcriptional regulator [Paenibacillus taichungensis]
MAKIDDVARLAGVSKGTVSNVFSQKRPTSKKVTEKVLQISKELNYVPNHIARSLVTKKTMAIGLTIPHGKFFFSVFHNQFINGVILEASNYGYRVLLDMIAAEEVKTPSLASYPIDGAIVLGPTEEDDRINLLYQHDIPFVTIGKIINKGLQGVSTVNNDNKQVMRDICDYLLGLGHRNIMFLNAGEQMTVSIERSEEFVRVLQEHGVTIEPGMIHYKPGIHSDKYIKYGYDETLHNVKNPMGRVTAIIADDDRTAFSALNAINDAGLRVPEDISLFVICGDQSMMHQVRPSLTGMDLQPSELGVQSVRLLMHKLGILEGSYENNRIVPSKIIERNSCSSIKN